MIINFANIIFSSIIEEAMEDGMWVVVSNCDNDLKFWTLINFKLYQLKLEARVHQNYRLFIIIGQSAVNIIPRCVSTEYCNYPNS